MKTTPIHRSDATSASVSADGPPTGVLVGLVAVMDRSVRALADAGEPVEASRLAARAWSLLHTTHPEQAEQINRAMHYLARREAELEAARDGR